MDKLDKKIISELTKNSRYSLQQISRKTKIPPSTVNYKLQKFISNKFLKAVVDLDETKLGYSIFQVFIKVRIRTNSQIENQINRLKKHPNVIWLVKTAGEFNYIVEIICKDIIEQEQITSEIKKVFHDDFLKQLTLIPNKQYKFTHTLPGFSLNDSDEKNWIIDYNTDKGNIKLDQTDKRILKSLKTNARKRIVKIADETMIDTATIIYRIRKMLDRKIINKFTILVDYKKLNYKGFVILINFSNFPDSSLLKAKVQQNKNIRYALTHLGRNSLYFLINVKESDEVFEMLNQFTEDYSELIENYKIFPIIEKYVENLVADCVLA